MIPTNYFVVTDFEDMVDAFNGMENLYKNKNFNPIIIGVRQDSVIVDHIIDQIKRFTNGNVEIKEPQKSKIMGVISIEVQFKKQR